MSLDNDNFEVGFRLWIKGKSGSFLGEGRVSLLEKIEETGSIREAASALQMSYQKAWKLMDIMNEQSPEPLIEKSTGGKKGGGTTLTQIGKDWVEFYRKWKSASSDSIHFHYQELSK